MNMFINRQLTNFQNCFGVLFRLCQVEGLHNNMLATTDGLIRPALENVFPAKATSNTPAQLVKINIADVLK